MKYIKSIKEMFDSEEIKRFSDIKTKRHYLLADKGDFFNILSILSFFPTLRTDFKMTYEKSKGNDGNEYDVYNFSNYNDVFQVSLTIVPIPKSKSTNLIAIMRGVNDNNVNNWKQRQLYLNDTNELKDAVKSFLDMASKLGLASLDKNYLN